MNWIENTRIILASGSPRRKELLAQAGFTFDVISSDVDETHPEGVSKYLIPEFLAEKKADSVFQNLTNQNDLIVIGADSIVILKDMIYEKPKDGKEAYRMLASLSGKEHTVITGVCLKSKDQTVSFSGRTEVLFRPMDHEEIEFYVNKYQPFDKAGAYGVQEWLGLCKVSRMEGTYPNVMGLPVDLVYEGIRAMIEK